MYVCIVLLCECMHTHREVIVHKLCNNGKLFRTTFNQHLQWSHALCSGVYSEARVNYGNVNSLLTLKGCRVYLTTINSVLRFSIVGLKWPFTVCVCKGNVH